MGEPVYRRKVPVAPDPKRAISSWRRRGFSDIEIVLIVKRELERSAEMPMTSALCRAMLKQLSWVGRGF